MLNQLKVFFGLELINCTPSFLWKRVSRVTASACLTPFVAISARTSCLAETVRVIFPFKVGEGFMSLMSSAFNPPPPPPVCFILFCFCLVVFVFVFKVSGRRGKKGRSGNRKPPSIFILAQVTNKSKLNSELYKINRFSTADTE